jgi:hypothetical protein
MTLEYQRGTVFVQGKRRKMWYGKYRVWQKDPSTGVSSAKQKTKKIGPKSEFSKRPVFPSGVGLVVSLTIASWYRRKEQNVALADFGRLPRSGRLSI